MKLAGVALLAVIGIGLCESDMAIAQGLLGPTTHRTGMDPVNGSQGERLGLTPSAVTGDVPVSRHAEVGVAIAKQQTIAWAQDYNARMMPFRIANAARARARKAEEAAARRRRAEMRLTGMNDERQLKKEFATEARHWTDVTLRFEVFAKLVDASDSEITLLKEDGKKVRVPVSRLCYHDQMWLKNFLRDREAGVSASTGVISSAKVDSKTGVTPSSSGSEPARPR